MNSLDELRSGRLSGARHLKLACGLSEFPREIFTLADTLEILDLSGNALSALPDDLPRLHRLRIIFCSDNRFTELPAVLGRCPQLSMVGFKANRIRSVPAAALPPQLRWLILTDNEIETLPDELGRRPLQKLMLAGNRLRHLPDSLAACHSLELLRIAANQLAEFPAALLALPRLAWLAYAGNPFCAATEHAVLAETPIPRIAWDSLDIEHQLGQGASGIIHLATHRQPEASQRVAVKLFKGAVTSDGLPHSEMAASIRAGRHPHLIPILGRIAAHPQQADGLVMALIDNDFRNLAGPPSLDSCTRDVYAAGTAFAPATALRIAHALASTAAHLHRQGIMHGDLYAHNILHCEHGRALLGDFGAASFCPPDSASAESLQRIEVRAYGCLLEELLARSPLAIERLHTLKDACLDHDVGQRPLFAEIVEELELAAASGN